mmetsp:Transcript_20088/g.51132  ORF Transcript_20088/g.51132 Transcript_20088/m.51132 type:complete len:105 (-) Transcript_20088:1640-1954(-)
MDERKLSASATGPISMDELTKLRDENDALERSIMMHTRKFDTKVDESLPLARAAEAPKAAVGGISVLKFNILSHFSDQAQIDHGTPFIPMQCTRRGHDGTMFTS